MRINRLMQVTTETFDVYWMLFKITVPIAIGAEILVRLGVIEFISPIFEPVMAIVGLPAEWGLAWLTAMIVGVWGALPLMFSLVPVSELSVADVTIFSALMLFAHGLPLEQKIIEQAGPAMWLTTLMRILGGLFYGIILHQLFSFTGWLSQPVAPTWIPLAENLSWVGFFIGLAEAMVWMLIVLLVLSWGLELLKITGAMDILMKAISPILRLSGIKGEAGQLTTVGLFLGISYGAGLLIKEARSGTISPRQVFLSCIFMGFIHAVIEDSLIVIALGADAVTVVLGRLIFAIIATALIALLLRQISDATFMKYGFRLARG